jgi:hypothetical protein
LGLRDEILNLLFTDSFVFGLYGRWGEGKTSVLNLLAGGLSASPDYIVVRFDPWLFEGGEPMLRALYEQVEKGVSQRYILPGFRKALAKYSRMASPKIEAGIKLDLRIEEETIEQTRSRISGYLTRTAKKVVILIDEVDRLQDREILQVLRLVRANASFKNTIFLISMDHKTAADKIAMLTGGKGNEYIEKIVQRPVLLPRVEQSLMDRLMFYSEHAVPTHAISQLAALPNGTLVSVVGTSSEILPDKLSLQDPQGGSPTVAVVVAEHREQFDRLGLVVGETLFTKGLLQDGAIVVPHGGELVRFRLSWTDKFLASLLKQGMISKPDIDQFNDEITHLYRSNMSKLFKDLRDVKRYINSLSSSLPPIVGEVNLTDFFLLEAIKVFYLELYDDISDNWWFYVDERWHDDFLQSPFSLSFSKQENVGEMRKQHINAVIDAHVQDPAARDVAKEIFTVLFPNVFGLFGSAASKDDARKTKRVWSSAFIKYFALKVPSPELPDSDIENFLLRAGASDSPRPMVERFMLSLRGSGQVMEFCDKLVRFYLPDISSRLALSIIETVTEHSDTLSKRGRGLMNLYRSEFDKGERLLLSLINEKVEPESVQPTLLTVLTSTPDFVFAVGIVQDLGHLREGSLHNVYKNAVLAELRAAVAKRLVRHFIYSGRDIFEELKDVHDWPFVLYQWGSNWGTFEGTNNHFVNYYVASLLRNDPKKFVTFLDHHRNQAVAERVEWNLQQIARVYDLQDLGSIASSFVGLGSLDVESTNLIRSFLIAMENYYESLKSNARAEVLSQGGLTS